MPAGAKRFGGRAADGMVGLGFLNGSSGGSLARGLSANGLVVVGGSGSEAIRWTSTDGMVGLGDFEGGIVDSLASGVSGDGSVVVGTGTKASGREVFIWDATNGMRELDQVLTDFGLDLTGWSLSETRRISDDGKTIVGWGTNPAGFEEAWIAVIPEPSTAALLATGLVALAVGRRRRAL